MTNAELEKIINFVFQDEEDALSIDRRRFMECFDNMLTERHTEVLRLRAIEGLTLEDTGKRLGITKERVRQIEAKAMRRLNASYFRHRFTTVTVEEMQEICRDLEDAKNEIASLKKDRDLYHRLLSKLVKDVIIPDVETSDPVEAGEKLIWSPSLIRRMERIDKDAEEKSEKARKAAHARWKSRRNGKAKKGNTDECSSNADAMKTHEIKIMKELTEADLLPCKNCGEKDFSIGVTVLYALDGPYEFIGSVECHNCERVQTSGFGEHRKAATQAAMRAWNQEQEETT